MNDETRRCIEEYCGNPGRSSHKMALAASTKIYECREELSRFFGLGIPENVVFTQNTTHSLNLVIKGLLKNGDHVIISDMEHNSVLRPILKLHKERGVRYDIFPTHPCENIINEVKKLIRRNTRLLICTHCPNISSAVMPIEELGELCRGHGILFAVDAAQSAGHLPIDMLKMNIDALCLPGHKGLYGIQGCGAVLLGENVILDTLTEGGNGINSLDGFMPQLPPERYESGTLPTPSIAALCAGVREISKIGLDKIRSDEEKLWYYACDRLMNLDNITVYESNHAGSVLLFNLDGIPSDTVAAQLGKMDICVRGGYHCAALGHKALGTSKGGAVRLGFGIFNTRYDVDSLTDALRTIKKFEYLRL